MDSSCPAASVRVDACSRRCITLVGLPPEDALHISLLAEILGWQVHMVSFDPDASPGPAAAAMQPCVHDPANVVDVPPVAGADPIGEAFIFALVLDRAVATQVHGGPASAGGLVLHMVARTIHVTCDDAVVSRQLAAMGLDRLVPPVPLCAIEQLLVFAG